MEVGMTFKGIVVGLLKSLLLFALFFVVHMAALAVFPSPLNWTPPAEDLPWVFVGMALVALVNTVLVSLVIVRSNWAGWRLVAAVAFSWYGVMAFMAQIETAWFGPALGIPRSIAVTVLLQTAVTVLVVTPAAVFIWGKFRQAETARDPNERLPQTASEWLWKLAIVAGLYLALYFGFGYVVAWQNPALREMYAQGADPAVFNSALLIPLQVARSALWVLFAVPVIRMARGPLWQAAVLVALLYALPMNIGHTIPNPIMPDASVRLSHFVETSTSNFIFGLAVTWLLAWRPRLIAHPA
jgi:hypothetical protein